MILANPTAVITPDDLLRMEDAVNYELVDGRLVERHMGTESSRIGLRIGRFLGNWVDERKLGMTLGADAGYQCFPDSPGKVRKPDASVILAGRLPGDRAPEGHCPVPPDLAVEVISPNDLWYEVSEKVAEYLAVGVRLVWVVDPPRRMVWIERPRSSPLGSVANLTAGDTITGEDVIPGFACAVQAFFE